MTILKLLFVVFPFGEVDFETVFDILAGLFGNCRVAAVVFSPCLSLFLLFMLFGLAMRVLRFVASSREDSGRDVGVDTHFAG